MLWACSVAGLISGRRVCARVKGSIYNGDGGDRAIRVEQTTGVIQQHRDGNLSISGKRRITIITHDWRKTSFHDVTDHVLLMDNISSFELLD